MAGLSQARWRNGGEYNPTTFWGPNPDDAPECGPLLREIGVVGTNVTECEPDGMGRHLPSFGLKAAPFLEAQPGVFFFGQRHDEEVVPAFRADREDPARRVRVPCFNDPAVRKELFERVERRVRSYDPNDVLYFSVTNEGTITHCCSPFDYCSCPHCAAGFREWLREQYGGLGSLNAAWGTSYTDWDQVAGMTTDRAKEIFAANPDASLAEWFAFRRFMDDSFHRVLFALRDRIRELAPGVPVALTGVWPPGAFGGQDWERISGEYDLLECYDEVGEMELARSLCGRTDLMHTIPGRAEPNHWDHTAWFAFVHGYRSEPIDPFSSLIDRKTLSPAEHAPRIAGWIQPLKKMAAALAGFARQDDPIFVLHSHASLVRKWVETELALDEDWAGREYAYPREHETYLINEMGWYRLIEDAGRQFEVLSTRVGLPDINGAGVLLILPMAVALSDDDVAWISAFLQSGGTVLRDSEVGRFDEELRLRPGRLADHERLIRFEDDMTVYPRRRCETFDPLPALEAFRPIVDRVLPSAWVRIESAEPGRFELTTFRKTGTGTSGALSSPKGGDGAVPLERLRSLPGKLPRQLRCRPVPASRDERILAVQRNDARLATGQPLADNDRPPAEVTLRFAEPAKITDILGNADHGVCDTLTLVIDPIRVTFLRCQPP